MTKKIDVVAAREVFETNRRIIVSAKVVRMSVWRDVRRYDGFLRKLEAEKEKEDDHRHVDLSSERGSTCLVIPFGRDVSPA